MKRQQTDLVVRFCGDSGDGMQLTGNLFASVSALLGNSISTFPDYPAEMRAPQGSLYQLFSAPGPHCVTEPLSPHSWMRILLHCSS